MRDVLSDIYHDRWIGRGRPIARPPRSSDFDALDFYLRGHIKTVVYAALADNEEALQHHIVDACQTIRNYPRMFERKRRSMVRRVGERIKSFGEHFEHLF
jgi:hypothetical protein